MSYITRIFGPPGTGKTTRLIKIVEDALARGVPPERIAYVSFSKKAVEEAIERAQAKFGFERDRFKYFRTLHALGFMMQGMRSDEQMTFDDYKSVADALGLEITEYLDNEDAAYGNKDGDQAMSLHALSRLRMITPEQELASAGQMISIRPVVLEQWINTVNDYKKKEGKHDFTDMLENYSGALPVEEFIVDEAQDLSKLQWWVVEQAMSEAKNVYIAGDDDQCIFSFSGAYVEGLLQHRVDKDIVLPQSFRVPRRTFDFANNIATKISQRHPKNWSSMDTEGKIMVDEPLDSLPLDNGEWMLLVRNTKFMRKIEIMLQDNGYLYNNTKYKYPRSIKMEDANLITNWNNLRKGHKISNNAAHEIMKRFAPRAPRISFEQVGMTDLPIPETLKEKAWYEVFNKHMTARTVEYIRSCLRNGQKISDKPRITLSTIHKVKGGESENVAIIPDVSFVTHQFLDTDTEHRVQYVGATRTKQNLYLVKPETDLFYRY